MAAGFRLLQRHNEEILEELTLVQVLFSGAAGATVVSLARLAQDGLDCSEALTMSFRRRRQDTFCSRTVKMVAKNDCVFVYLLLFPQLHSQSHCSHLLLQTKSKSLRPKSYILKREMSAFLQINIITSPRARLSVMIYPA